MGWGVAVKAISKGPLGLFGHFVRKIFVCIKFFFYLCTPIKNNMCNFQNKKKK